MGSQPVPKEFEKMTEVLPFTKYGLSSFQEFKEVEKDLQELECLKKAGLNAEEITLYRENEAGSLGQRKKIESDVMKKKLNDIYTKVNNLANAKISSEDEVPEASTSNCPLRTPIEEMQKKITFYPNGHPMNNIKEIEQNLFGHLKSDDMMSITKRRKVLRRLERKKDRIVGLENQISIDTVMSVSEVDRPGSLWDKKEMPQKRLIESKESDSKPVIGPKKQTMYTIKDNKIVRLEPIQSKSKEYKAVDIVMPVNDAEMQLLEGTKMSIDDIKKIERFKDYEPGVPSKTLYIKNIASSVSQERLTQLFLAFTLANGGPIDVRLMSGRMRGQAFVSFHTIDIATQALEETNGTILSGKPIVVAFGRANDTAED